MPLYFVAVLVVLALVIPTTSYDAALSLPAKSAPVNDPVPASHVIAFVPNASAAVAAVMQRVVSPAASVASFRNLPVLGFATDGDVQDFYVQNPGLLFAAVEFTNLLEDGSLPPDVQVTLRLNDTTVPSTLARTIVGGPGARPRPSPDPPRLPPPAPPPRRPTSAAATSRRAPSCST